MIIWLTGIPAAGKTTLGRALAEKIGASMIDGDEVRRELDNYDFSREGRRRNVVRIALSAALMAGDVVVACVSPFEDDRSVARYIAEKLSVSFMMVWVRCPRKVAMDRDPKGLYAKARAGEIKNLTGYNAPYGSPNAECVIDTDAVSVEECVRIIEAKIKEKR